MLATTTDLIQYLQQDKERGHFTVIHAMLHTLLSCGSEEDAAALAPVFLSQPGDVDHSQLLPVLQQLGNRQLAETIFHAVTTNQRLNEGVAESVLQLFGRFRLQAARPLLVYYALEQEPYDYYLSQHAVLGLLHFDLSELKPLIKSSIEKCYGQHLFPEFVPALVGKLDTAHQEVVLEKLYEMGATTASPDCLGGIVLGFSLCGAAGAPYFWKVLFDTQWELVSGATGARRHAYSALQNLGISFGQLFEKVKAMEEASAQQYALDILLQMLELKIDEPIVANSRESIAHIYTTLFVGDNNPESTTLTGLAEKLDRSPDADRLEKLLELKLKEEIFLKNYAAMKKESRSNG